MSENNAPENESFAFGWRSYSKIDTAEARSETGSREIIPGKYRTKAIEYLAELPWIFHEKIDGTNMSAFWDGHRVWINDRRGLNKTPKPVMDLMQSIFCTPEAEELFEQLFKDRKATIYGECFGASVQAVGKLYSDTLRFSVFDVKVEGRYLEYGDEMFDRVLGAFGLDSVPFAMICTLRKAIDFVKTQPKSLINEQAPMEGLVGRPKVNLFADDGRVIVKIKVRDYVKDTYEKWNWIKQGKRVYVKDEYGRQSEAMVRLVESKTRRVEDENTIVRCTTTWSGASTEEVIVPAGRIVKAESKKWKGPRDKSLRPKAEMSPEQEAQ